MHWLSLNADLNLRFWFFDAFAVKIRHELTAETKLDDLCGCLKPIPTKRIR